jgi:hypothetical protein
MTEHISAERLLLIATSDEVVFTMEEFNHIKMCRECFLAWSEFIWQAPSGV